MPKYYASDAERFLFRNNSATMVEWYTIYTKNLQKTIILIMGYT